MKPAPRWARIAAWTVGELIAVFLNQTTHMPAPSWAVLLECVLVGALGFFHARLPDDDWRASLLGPVLWFTFLPAAWAHYAELSPTWNVAVLVPAVVLAIVGMTAGLARLFSKIPPALVVFVLLPLASLYGRYLTLEAGYASDSSVRLLEQLQSPFVGAPAPERPDHGPVILLVVDTLRWDHAVRMRSWKRLAAKGATWERAMSTASWTIPSMGSVFTGELPGVHGAGSIPGSEDAFSPLDPEIPYLPQALNQEGWATAGYAANPILAHSLGFSRGFDAYSTPVDRPAHPLTLMGRVGPRIYDARWLTEAGERWMADAPESGWFLWLQLFEPHVPYEHTAALGLPYLEDRDELIETPPEQRQAVKQAYQAEVDYADAALMDFLDHLDATEFWEHGTLILTADHGEELWDHGGAAHGHSHHGEVVDVALVVVGPGIEPGARTTNASLIDVHGTIAAIAGLPSQGRDLRLDVPADRLTFAAGNLRAKDQRSARGGTMRAILTCQEDQGEVAAVYDLSTDPTEHRPLPTARAPRLVSEAALLKTAAEGRTAVDWNTGHLEALGYVSADPEKNKRIDCAR